MTRPIAELKEKLLAQINKPPKPPTYSEAYQIQQINPEAMSQARLSEFQSHGWFTDYRFNPELYAWHKAELDSLATPDSQ